jgi:RNA polymerase sigma factor (sigma-70 family)
MSSSAIAISKSPVTIESLSQKISNKNATKAENELFLLFKGTKNCNCKYPVTNEGLAQKVRNGLASEAETGVFVLSHRGFAKWHSNKPGLFYYHKKNGSNNEDEAQEVFTHILTKLNQYNPKYAYKGWSYKVVDNKMRDIRKNLKRSSCFYEIDENKHSSNDKKDLKLDFKNAARNLAKKHPTKKDIIYAILGNPKENYTPTEINYARIAEKIGCKSNQIRKVYLDIVEPYILENFSEYLKS